jgi:hypothetical protein
MLLSILSVAASLAVGLVFLYTGGLKALSPAGTVNHFDKLNLMPYPLLRWFLGFGAVVECTLGVALIARVYPEFVFPGSTALLLSFIGLTYWSSKAKGVDDCGCYGQYVVTPAASMLLDCLYAALIGFAWAVPVAQRFSSSLQLAIVAQTAIFCGTVTFMSHWAFRNWGKDILDLSLAQTGSKWKTEWFGGYGGLDSAPNELFILMSPTCSVCKAWIKPLNKIAALPDMPRVVAGMAATEVEISAAVSEFGIDFLVLRVQPAVMDRLTSVFPTAITVDGGMVTSKQEGALPAALIARLKGFQRERPAPVIPLTRDN